MENTTTLAERIYKLTEIGMAIFWERYGPITG